MPTPSDIILGFAFRIINRTLGITWYGTPLEILGSLSDLPLTFKTLWTHPNTEIDYFPMFQEHPLLRWHGGPHAEHLMQLLDAVHANDLPSVRHLLKVHPVLTDPRTDGSHVPVISATFAGQLAMVDLLATDSVSANLVGHLDMTPLHWAAACGHTAIALLLRDRGGDLSARNWLLLTPPEQAQVNGHRQLARLLGLTSFPLTKRGRCDLVIARMAKGPGPPNPSLQRTRFARR